jgi:V-type H+-transporting ATPase subunit a
MTNKIIDDSLNYFKKMRNPTCSYIEELKLYVLKEKGLYHQMNLLKVQNTMIIGELWCPKEQEQ